MLKKVFYFQNPREDSSSSTIFVFSLVYVCWKLKSRIFERIVVGIKGHQPRKTAVSRGFPAYLLDYT